ncbi:rRNA maturation RNase YbeY [Candidatus Nomurabacteria bacterium]|nr:rRNA maturation RNase YbeY [Candidatus Nomurabacteria bacterium]
MEEKLSVINKTKGKLPSLPFVDIKNDILGKEYSLSIAFVNKKQSQEINKKYRNKDNPTNILSFDLNKTEGELVLCPAVVKREAKNFEKNFTQFLGFLVIHGMLHLKGLDHSSTMDREQDLFFAKYDQKYFCGHRCRLDNDKSRSRRVLKRRKES